MEPVRKMLSQALGFLFGEEDTPPMTTQFKRGANRRSSHVKVCISFGPPLEPTAGNLLFLPAHVLGRIWPAERVSLGTKVCRLLHRDLLEHAGTVVWKKKSEYINESRIAKDISNYSHLAIQLRWEKERFAFSKQKDWPTEDGKFVEMVMRGCKELTLLDLSNNKIRPAGAAVFADALQYCKALADLNLENTEIGDNGFRPIAMAMKECKELAHLNLKFNELESVGSDIAAVLGACSGMEALKLSSNKLGAQGLGELVEVVGGCRRLSLLHIAWNKCRNQQGVVGMTSVTARIVSECKSLTDLDVSVCYDRAEAPLANLLATPLGQRSGLRRLNMEQNPMGDDWISNLAVGLGQCKNLTYLNLSDTGIGPEASPCLAAVVGECKGLIELDLHDNRLGDSGVAHLSSALKQNHVLSRLVLNHNFIGDDGASKLAGVLGGCKPLAFLDVSRNDINDDGALRLAGLLAQSEKLTTLKFEMNHISQDGQTRIRALAQASPAPVHVNMHEQGDWRKEWSRHGR